MSYVGSSTLPIHSQPRPYVYGKELVLEFQERHDLPTPIAILIRFGQEILLADAAKQFYKKVEFDPDEHDAIRRLFPAGPASPVVIDPLVRFGRPSVSGVATERLWELADAGETIDEIADGYDLSMEDVPPHRVRGAVPLPRCVATIVGQVLRRRERPGSRKALGAGTRERRLPGPPRPAGGCRAAPWTTPGCP